MRSNMSTAFQYGRAIDGQHIRLLQIEQSPEPTITCTLKEVPFDPSSQESQDFSSIFALSYCWGTEEATERILVNNEPFMIRPNLLEAIKYILPYACERSGEVQCSFWIDAICINQDDNEEKAAQLDLMSVIYGKMQVLIWLGPEERGSDSVVHVFRWLELRRLGESLSLIHAKTSWRHYLTKRIQKRIYKEEFSKMTHLAISTANMTENNLLAFERLLKRPRNKSTFARHEEDEHILPKEHPWWEAMVSLLTRPWFFRVWTLQEVVLAQDAMVICGSAQISWAIFKDCRATFLRQFKLYSQNAVGSTGRSPEMLSRLISLNNSSILYEETFSQKAGINILRQLYLYGDSLMTTNPKDYLYGFLALAGSDVRHRVRKEYDDGYPVARVFVQAVNLCCQVWRGEAIEEAQKFWLQFCYTRLHRSESGMAGLPSWCLDLSLNTQETARDATHLGDHSLGDEDKAVSLRSDARWACKGITVRYPELIITGLHVDTIEQYSPLPATRSAYTYEKFQLAEPMCRHAHEWATQITQSLADGVVSEWFAKYLHPGIFLRNSGRVPLALGDQQQELMAVLKAVAGIRKVEDVVKEEPLWVRIGIPEQRCKDIVEYLEAILVRNSGRYFFSTSDGRLGYSLQPCKTGQILCYFPRGRYFHILEPLLDPDLSQPAGVPTKQYKHVGTAVVHGLGGDGLESLPYTEDDFQEFHIV